MVEKSVSSYADNSSIITKMPFLSSSSNLFDVFFIIGYEQDEVNNDIMKNVEDIIATPSKWPKMSNQSTSFFSVYTPRALPIIINTICNVNERVSMLSEEEIINFTFPDTPSAYYYIVDPNPKDSFEPNQYNVIFYLNNDTIDGRKKMTRSCFSFVFYEMREKKMQIKNELINGEVSRLSVSEGTTQLRTVKVFIPKAICFISEYPFFTQFEKAAKKLLSFFYRTDISIQIPVEILIYNLINFSPCPIKSKINFAFFPEQFEIKQDLESVMTLQQLSGYPLFDFNFSEIFSILPIVTIAEIVICNILEIDMLFFSKNIEVLNIVMFIIAGLNYPCNDSNYHWFILSLSQDEFENRADKSLYMSKPGSAMLGVNCSYTPSINLKNFAFPVFVADLDNKEFLYRSERAQGYEEDDNDNEKTVKLIQYIHETIQYKKSITNSHFEKSLITLISELETKAKKVIHLNSNQSSQIVPRFLVWDHASNVTNRMIQELFYDFNLNIFQLFYKFTFIQYNIKQSNRKKKRPNDFSIEFDLRNKKFTFDEQALCDLISNSSKVNNFIRSFVQRSECQMETFQIPLMFSEEFIQIKTTSQSKENIKMAYFDVIDRFYGILSQNTKGEPVNFNSFYKYYSSELKEEYANYIRESSNFTSTKVTNHKSTYQYKCVELDKTILYKYMYFINNLSQSKLEELFPSIVINNLNQKLDVVPSFSVTQYIENFLLLSKIMTLTDIVSICCVLFFGFTIEQNQIMSIKEFGILALFKNIQYCQRKYILIIFDILLKMYSKTQSQWIMSNLNELTGFIIKENVIPNRLMMNLLEMYSVLKKISPLTETSSQSSIETKGEAEVNLNEEVQSKPIEETASKKEPNVDAFKNILAYNGKQSSTVKNSMYLKKNNCRDGFFKEDSIMAYANNPIYEGNIKINCHKCNSEISPVYFIQFKKKSFESLIFSPLKILNLLLDLFKEKFHSRISLELFNKADFDTLSKIALILLFYLNNTQMKLDKEEKGAFEYLLMLYLEDYHEKSLK